MFICYTQYGGTVVGFHWRGAGGGDDETHDSVTQRFLSLPTSNHEEISRCKPPKVTKINKQLLAFEACIRVHGGQAQRRLPSATGLV